MADTQEFLEDGVMSLVLQFTDKLPLKATEIGYEVIAEQQQMLVKAILQHFQQEQEDRSIKEIADTLNGSGSHACYCPRSVDGGCKCALKDEYLVPYAEVDGKKPYYTQSEVDRLIREAVDAVLDELIEWYEAEKDFSAQPFNWYGAVKSLKVSKDYKKPFDTLSKQEEGSKS